MAQYAVAMQMPVLCLSAEPWRVGVVICSSYVPNNTRDKKYRPLKNLADWKVDNTLAIQLSKW
jgi:hypothetical protein